MIRHCEKSGLLLFTQHDHALLSGRLAECLSGDVIAKASAATIEGISLHDCGWPLHDDRPTLNSTGEPLHVFETPVWLATHVWSVSARRAANQNPYAGLIVSLHGLNLATLVMQHRTSAPELFELNKFQHQQIELQEQLRQTLGMRIDRPLDHGLARPATCAKEDQLLFDYHLLRAMDQLSLELLCSEKLFEATEQIDSRPNGTRLRIRLEKPTAFQVRLDPWPFDQPVLTLPVPCRRMESQTFAETEAFRKAYGQSPVEQVKVLLSPTR